MLTSPLARPRPAMRRVARPRPIGAACLGALLVLSMSTTTAPLAAADSGACLVGASASSTRPNTLEVMFAGCAYVVSDAAPPYTIELVGSGYSRQLYPGFRSYWAVKALGWHLVSTNGVRNGSAEPSYIDTSIVRGLY